MAGYGIEISVHIDFVNDALSATDTWTDVTTDIDSPVDVVTGRARLADAYQPGSGTLTFHDPNRNYDPENTSGAHFGDFDARRKIRIRGRRSGTTTWYPIFRGYVDTWSPDYGGWDGSANRTTIKFTDAVPLLKLLRLPESVWEEAISQETGVEAWFRWRDPPGSAVVADSSGNVANGVYKRILSGPSTAVYVGHTEETASDVSKFKRQSIIPYGGPNDVGFDIAAQVPGAQRSYTSYLNVVKPALGVPQPTAGTVSGKDWSIEMWVHWAPAWQHSATGDHDRSLAAHRIPLVQFGVDQTTETIFKLEILTSSTATPAVDIVQWESVTSGTPTTWASVNVTRDGLAHHIVCTSVTNGANAEITLVVDNGSAASNSAVTVQPGASQLCYMGYTGFIHWMNGAFGETVFYDREISLTEIDAHYAASANPNPDQLPGARIGDALDRVSWPAGLRSLDTGYSENAPVDWGQRSIWDYCTLVSDSDAGYLFIDESGIITWRDRRYWVDDVVGNTSQATFTDDGVPGSVDVQMSSAEFGRDMSQLVNYCRVTLEGEIDQIDEDTTSQSAYGRVDRVINSTLAGAADAASLADWVVANRKDPAYSVTSVTTDAMDLFTVDAVLSDALLSHRATVIRTPATGSAISHTVLITSKRWRINPDGTYVCTTGFDPLPTNTGWV